MVELLQVQKAIFEVKLYPHESSGLFVFYTKVDPMKFGQHDRYLYPQSFNPFSPPLPLFYFTKKNK
jgi:hypothetical protein